MRPLSILLVTLLSSFAAYSQSRGTVLDIRDGQVYNTITIGNKVWMAKNLNYNVRGSWCFNNKDENCVKYGRIYDWATIMNGNEKEGSQGICPEGWHVSTFDEWAVLIEEFKKTKDLLEGGISNFNMQFAGCRFPNGKFEFLNSAATYWTSSIDKENNKYVYTFYAYSDKLTKPLISYSTNKTYGQYLRCVKD